MNYISAGKYLGLKKIANDLGHFLIFGVEHHHVIGKEIQEILQLNDLPDQAIRSLKDLVLRRISPECSGVIVDPVYSLASAAMTLDNSIGVGIALDSDEQEQEDSQQVKMITKITPNWNVNKTKRLGASCVKINVNYDASFESVVLQRQRDLAREVGRQCTNFDIAYMLHLKVGSSADLSNARDSDKLLTEYLRAIDIFAHSDYGVDLLVVDLPHTTSSLPDPESGHHRQVARVRDMFAAINNGLDQAWLIANSDVNSSPQHHLLLLGYALEAGASGLLMGDALWRADFAHFPNIPRMDDSLQANAVRLVQDLKRICNTSNNPWYERAYYASGSERARPHQVESRYFPSLYPSVKVDI